MALHQSAEEFAQGAAVSMAWGRIFFLYGPGEAPARLVPSIILPLLGGQRAICRQGSHVRDLLHVSDVAAAFVALLDSDARGAVNIASGCPATLGQVAKTIARILEKSRMLDVQESQPLPDNPATITADTRRLNEEVGWRPVLSLEQGLRQTIDWWKGQ
jgi:nucleoside-diphosphate-sugar epimerase